MSSNEAKRMKKSKRVSYHKAAQNKAKCRHVKDIDKRIPLSDKDKEIIKHHPDMKKMMKYSKMTKKEVLEKIKQFKINGIYLHSPKRRVTSCYTSHNQLQPLNRIIAEHVVATLNYFGGSSYKACGALGMPRRTLTELLDKLSYDPNSYKVLRKILRRHRSLDKDQRIVEDSMKGVFPKGFEEISFGASHYLEQE